MPRKKETLTAIDAAVEVKTTMPQEQQAYKEIRHKIGEDDIVINLRPSLTFEERTIMTENIANFPFVDGDYISYMRDIGRYSYVFTFYTDLDIASMSVEDIYRLSQDHDLLKKIYESVDDDIGMIFADADQMIEWRKEKLLRRSSDELYESLTAIVLHLETLLSKTERDFDPSRGGINMQQLVDALTGLKAQDEKTLAHNVLDFQEAQKRAAGRTPKRRTPIVKAPSQQE